MLVLLVLCDLPFVILAILDLIFVHVGAINIVVFAPASVLAPMTPALVPVKPGMWVLRIAAETHRLVLLVLGKFLAILDKILVNQKYLVTGLNLLNIPDKGKFRNLLEMILFFSLFSSSSFEAFLSSFLSSFKAGILVFLIPNGHLLVVLDHGRHLVVHLVLEDLDHHGD